jgi:hypothetical protein
LILIYLLTGFVGVIASTIAIKEIHQTIFVVVIFLDTPRVSSCLVNSRLSSSPPLTGFNNLLNNILSSITSGRLETLSILSFLYYILCKL